MSNVIDLDRGTTIFATAVLRLTPTGRDPGGPHNYSAYIHISVELLDLIHHRIRVALEKNAPLFECSLYHDMTPRIAVSDKNSGRFVDGFISLDNMFPPTTCFMRIAKDNVRWLLTVSGVEYLSAPIRFEELLVLKGEGMEKKS